MDSDRNIYDTAFELMRLEYLVPDNMADVAKRNSLNLNDRTDQVKYMRICIDGWLQHLGTADVVVTDDMKSKVAVAFVGAMKPINQ